MSQHTSSGSKGVMPLYSSLNLVIPLQWWERRRVETRDFSSGLICTDLSFIKQDNFAPLWVVPDFVKWLSPILCYLPCYEIGKWFMFSLIWKEADKPEVDTQSALPTKALLLHLKRKKRAKGIQHLVYPFHNGLFIHYLLILRPWILRFILFQMLLGLSRLKRWKI